MDHFGESDRSRGEASAERIVVGGADNGRALALLRRAGASPGLFWMGGYRSDMRGTKADAVDSFGADRGLAVTRFDYSGHGESDGVFEEGTISRWLADARAAFDTTAGPQIIIGSSMGGWLALLLVRALRSEGLDGRAAGLVLIAPAVDMTSDLMWDRLSKAARAELSENGIYFEPNPYGGDPTPITLKLIEDGKAHLFGDALIECGCPVHILQGAKDVEVPPRHALALVERLASDDVVLTLVKDGDHRLSRPEDIERLKAAIADIVDGD